MVAHPAPPEREEELTEHADMWQDKMTRLEAQGDEFKLAPMLKIQAVRMLMACRAKEHFTLGEADRDTGDQGQRLLKKEKVG